MIRKLWCRIVGHRWEQAEIPFDRCTRCKQVRTSYFRMDAYRFWRPEE